VTEKQKEHVQMKVDEPNTPYIRYDPVTDQVTNWQGKLNSIFYTLFVCKKLIGLCDRYT
jgi:hypothetical protein